MRQTFSPHFVEMLAWYWCEVSISTLQFFIVPALDIWLLPSWDVHFISVWLHPPICLNKAVQPSGGGKQGGGGDIHTFWTLSCEGEHFLPLHNVSFGYKRRSLWVLVPCSTYSRHSNSKRMRMSRSLWCLQDWVEQAASYTKQFLCTLLADGEQATSQCKTTSAKTKRPPENKVCLCQWMFMAYCCLISLFFFCWCWKLYNITTIKNAKGYWE